MVVADDFQRRGVGPKLLNALMSIARREGLWILISERLTLNDNVRKLLERNLERIGRVCYGTETDERWQVPAMTAA